MSEIRASQPPLRAPRVAELERCVGLRHSAGERWPKSREGARKLGRRDLGAFLLAVAPFGGLGEAVGETEKAARACWSALCPWLGEEIRAASLQGSCILVLHSRDFCSKIQSDASFSLVASIRLESFVLHAMKQGYGIDGACDCPATGEPGRMKLPQGSVSSCTSVPATTPASWSSFKDLHGCFNG